MNLKHNLLSISVMLTMCLPSFAGITIKLPTDYNKKNLDYSYAPIEKLATAKSRAERGIINESVPVKNSIAEIEFPKTTENLCYTIKFDNEWSTSLYVTPKDEITVDILSLDPFRYEMNGTPLVEEMTRLDNKVAPFMDEYAKLALSENPDTEAIMDIYERLDRVYSDFIIESPKSPAAPVALLQVEEFMPLYEKYGEDMKSSIVYPLVAAEVERQEKMQSYQKKQEAMESEEAEAPGFTLENINGGMTSLSEFKGKWVILDFWGSWCGWCIKGIPELKEAYKKYTGTLEIIGIDCNEGQDAWRAGVKEYELPWVNVYCPAGNSVINEYGVQGYPTKVIIDPEGKIRNITTGHNPEFFTVLDQLINKK